MGNIVTDSDSSITAPLEQVRTMLARVASAPARERIEKTLVLWELGYLRESLSQFRVTAEETLRRLLALCPDQQGASSMGEALDKGQTSAVIERLHHELELIPARVGLQLYTLLAWGNYASHHQKLGHQARASDLAILVSISLDLLDWAGQEVDGEGSIYDIPRGLPHRAPAGGAVAGAVGSRGSAELLQSMTRFLLERAGARLQVDAHRISIPDLSLEIYWARPVDLALRDEPYRGLRCFEPEDAGCFYGRDGLIQALEQSADTRRLTVISGDSGAGKTSLLRAGLLPRLLDLGCGVIYLAEYGAEGLALVQGLRELWRGRPLVLVLDQLERALLPGVDQPVQRAALNLVAEVGQEVQGRRVVAGVREDFLGRLLREAGLQGAPEPGESGVAGPGIITAGTLGEAECREAITRPLEGRGVELAPGLLEEVLLPELIEHGGAAPSKLQIVCSRLYEEARAQGRSMDLGLYRDLGGAERILRSYLDQALTSGRYQGEEELARALLKTMTGPEVRRWAGLGTLWQRLHGASQVTDEVQLRSLLSRLTDDRLVVSRSGGPGAPVRYSLMHDQLAAIVRTWRSAAELERQEAQERLDRALAAYHEDPRRQELLRGAGLKLVEGHFPRLRKNGSGSRAEELMAASRRGRRLRRLSVALMLGAALLGGVFGLLQLRQAVKVRDHAIQLADQGVMLHAQQELPRDPSLAVAWLRNLSRSTSGIAGLALVEQARRLGVAWVLTGHRDVVTSVAFSPDGKLLASGGRDGTVRLHHLSGAFRGEVLSRHGAAVQRVAFSPDGRTMASGGRDGVVRLHGVGPDRTQVTLGEAGGGVDALAFSPGGRILAWAGEDPGVRLWDLKKRRSTRTLLSDLGGSARVLTLSFASGGGLLATGDSAGNIAIWDLKRGVQVESRMRAHHSAVHALTFSPDGQSLASAGLDHRVRLWSPGDGLAGTVGQVVNAGKVLALAFSPDGRILASAGAAKEVLFHDAADGGEVKGEPPLRGHLGAIHDLAISGDGTLLATASRDHTIRLWDLTARRAPAKGVHVLLRGHKREVWSAAFTPDGARLVSAGTGGEVRLWGGGSGEPLGQPLGHGSEAFALAVSPDGARMVSAGWGGEVRLFSLGKEPRRLASARVGTGAIYAAAFTPDSGLVALGGSDGTVYLLDGKTLKPAAVGAAMAHPEALHSLLFVRGGERLVTGCRDGLIRIWDMAGRKLHGQPLGGHGAAVYALAMNPDGRSLASGSGDATIRFWDLSAQVPGGKSLQGHHSWVLALAYAPDGRTLASGSSDGTIRFWDPIAHRPLGPPLHGHHDWVHTVSFSPDGQTLASGSSDGTLWLWRLSPSRLPRLNKRIDAMTNMRVSLDGRVSYWR